MPREKKESDRRWLIGIVCGVLGTILGTGVSFYIFHRQLGFATNQMRVDLSRDLAKEFYQGKSLYRDVSSAIESCGRLYKPWGGTFTHAQLNQYLGFFEDLGFYRKQDALTLEIIDHFFGAYAIEAFEYPEIRKYIALVRTSMDQQEAFNDFEELVTLIEKNPAKQREINNARNACKDGPKN